LARQWGGVALAGLAASLTGIPLGSPYLEIGLSLGGGLALIFGLSALYIRSVFVGPGDRNLSELRQGDHVASWTCDPAESKGLAQKEWDALMKDPDDWPSASTARWLLVIGLAAAAGLVLLCISPVEDETVLGLIGMPFFLVLVFAAFVLYSCVLQRLSAYRRWKASLAVRAVHVGRNWVYLVGNREYSSIFAACGVRLLEVFLIKGEPPILQFQIALPTSGWVSKMLSFLYIFGRSRNLADPGSGGPLSTPMPACTVIHVPVPAAWGDDVRTVLAKLPRPIRDPHPPQRGRKRKR
jgi:hypothetical protein